jgi:hypothetical protein
MFLIVFLLIGGYVECATYTECHILRRLDDPARILVTFDMHRAVELMRSGEWGGILPA